MVDVYIKTFDNKTVTVSGQYVRKLKPIFDMLEMACGTENVFDLSCIKQMDSTTLHNVLQFLRDEDDGKIVNGLKVPDMHGKSSGGGGKII